MWNTVGLLCDATEVKGKVLYGQEHERRIYYHCWGQLSTTFRDATEVPNFAKVYITTGIPTRVVGTSFCGENLEAGSNLPV